MADPGLLVGLAWIGAVLVYLCTLWVAWRRGWVHPPLRALMCVLRPVIHSPEAPTMVLPPTLTSWCVCGSKASAEHVEVEYEPGVLTIVGSLCPDCRVQRSGPSLRVEAERARVKAAALSRVVIPVEASPPTTAEQARRMLTDRQAAITALAADWSHSEGVVTALIAEGAVLRDFIRDADA